MSDITSSSTDKEKVKFILSDISDSHFDFMHFLLSDKLYNYVLLDSESRIILFNFDGIEIVNSGDCILINNLIVSINDAFNNNQSIITFSDNSNNTYELEVEFIKVDSKDTKSKYKLAIIKNNKYQKEAQRNKLESIVENIPLCITVFNENLERLVNNKKAEELFGIERTQGKLETFYKLSPKYQPNGMLSEELALLHIDNAFKNGFEVFYWLHLNAKGEELPCEITMSKVDMLDFEEVVFTFIRDLRSEFAGDYHNNLYETYFRDKVSDKTFFNAISNLSSEWFFSFDNRTGMMSYYGKIIEEYGYNNVVKLEPEIAIDSKIVHEDDVEFYQKFIENLKKGKNETIDIRFRMRDGGYKYCRLVYEVVFEADQPIFAVGKSYDVNDEKIMEKRSKVDLLTGCYNKVTAEHLISEIINSSRNTSHAFFIVDIDNFKGVNDNLGHFFGDEVLQQISANLKGLFRTQDIIARIGGDEFIVFIQNVNNNEILKQKAKLIVDVFNDTFLTDYKDFSISGSVGVSLYPKDANDYEELYKAADKALYKAKELGKNQYVFYDASMEFGLMKNLTELDNSKKTIGTFFDYDLISSVFEILYERNADVVSVNLVLKHICERYDADRCYIIETYDQGSTYNNTYEWHKPGIISNKKILQNRPTDFFKGLLEVSKNGILYSNDLDSIFKDNDSYRAMCTKNVMSFIHSQVTKFDYISFVLGLDDCKKKRVWSEKEINTIQHISKVISIIFQSKLLQKEVNTLTEYNQMSATISDNADDVVYVVDINNHELIYINKATIKLLGNPKESSWKGKKCYQILQGLSSPCSFCTNHLLNEEDFYVWKYFNPVFNKTFLLKDKLIRMNGELARLEIATDITKLVELEEELKEKLNQETVLVSCINTLHSNENPEASIKRLLENITNFYHSKRSYLLDIVDNGILIKGIYEANTNESDIKENEFIELQPEIYSIWRDAHKQVGEFKASSFEDMKLNPELKKMFDEHGVSTLLTAHIKDNNGRITGLIGVDNPAENLDKTVLLNSVAKFIAIFQDETKMLKALNNLSYYDNLTGTMNRHSYNKTLREINETPIKSLGVAYIDINQLNMINIIQGNEVGDQTIKTTAKILSSVFPNCVYRVGGDEFIILDKDVEESVFEVKVKQLHNNFYNHKEFKVSIGFTWNTIFSENQSSTENADKYVSMLSQTLDNEILSGKFTVYLQPQVIMDTGEVASAEALVRRFSANGTVQPPVAFIPFYEKEGIISKIDFFVFEAVCKKLNEWKNSSYKDIKIAVNFSRNTLTQDNVVKKLSDMCSLYSVEKSQLVIEITETISGAGDEVLSEIISKFAKVGFAISLDDFGSGLSNLSALMLTDFDEIKIDKGLTDYVHIDKKSRTLTKVALSLCNELEGLVSVAEGIEYEEQLNILKELNCYKGQGYYFDKPMPFDEFETKYMR